MAKAIPNPEPAWGGEKNNQGQDIGENHPSGLQPWNPDDALREEMARLTAEHPQLPQGDTQPIRSSPQHDNSRETENLRNENIELRSIIAELRQLLDEAEKNAGNEQGWIERQKEYESLLEEKSELIRSLHLKLKDSQEQKPVAAATPKEEELIAMSEELERERGQIQQDIRRIEEERRQLQEDEQGMTQQMREMEVQMARERADLARQRTELQRLNDEIRHELDRMERDRGLTDRLIQLRQRHQEAMNRKGNNPASDQNPSPGVPQTPAQTTSQSAQDPRKKKDSGLLKRFFG